MNGLTDGVLAIVTVVGAAGLVTALVLPLTTRVARDDAHRRAERALLEAELAAGR